MNVKNLLSLAAGASLLAGSVALADGPVARPDGTTITPASTNIGAQVVYPQGCDSIYESFNDTYPPNYGVGWTISNWSQIGCWGPAHKFTSDSDADLCQILVSATHVTGQNQYLVRLHDDDAGGGEPGTVLGSWEFFDLPPNQAGPTPLVECDATGISLQSGHSYWLSIIPSGSTLDTWGVLRQSTLPGNERTYDSWKCDHWQQFGNNNVGAWRITATQGGGGLSLRVGGNCPGQVNVAWAGATPNKTMGIAFANSTGSFVIPGGPCGGTTLGLSSSGLRLVNTINTGSGTGNVNGNAGTAACGRYLQLVVVEGSPCTTSNTAQIP